MITVRAALGPRKFRPWYRQHFNVGHDAIYRYIKVADKWDAIFPMVGQIKTVTEAIALISNKDKITKKVEVLKADDGRLQDIEAYANKHLPASADCEGRSPLYRALDQWFNWRLQGDA